MSVALPAAAAPRRLLVAGVQLAGIATAAFLFAQVEIQIEGSRGWAEGLPVSFRVQGHWLLDIFWGGRPLTGYHAWVFPFVAAILHLTLLLAWTWSWRLQARVLGAIMLFWVIEDALWFVFNPNFGWAALSPGTAWWHPRWFLGLPLDYWSFGIAGILLHLWSHRLLRWRRTPPSSAMSS